MPLTNYLFDPTNGPTITLRSPDGLTDKDLSIDDQGKLNLDGSSMDDARIETGKYTGDGATSQVISLIDSGLIVKFVKVWNNETTNANVVVVMVTSDDYVDEVAAGLAIDMKQDQAGRNRIIAVSTGSFTVDDNGANEDPNVSGKVYQYMVLGT